MGGAAKYAADSGSEQADLAAGGLDTETSGRAPRDASGGDSLPEGGPLPDALRDAADGASSDDASSDDASSDDASSDDASSDDASSDDASSDDASSDDLGDSGAPGDSGPLDTPEPLPDAPDSLPDAAGAPDAGDSSDALSDTAADVSSGAAADASSDASATDAAPPPCNPPKIPPVDVNKLPLAAFSDVTKAYGFDPLKPYAICAQTADLDGDLRADITVIELGSNSATVHAVLLPGGKPEHVYSKLNTTMLYPDMGCAVFDLTSDDHPDLLVGGSSGMALYAGDGKGGFKEQTDTWLPVVMTFAAWTIAPVDLDGDGDLDLYIGAGPPPGTPLSGGPPCKSQECGYEPDGDFRCVFLHPPPVHPSFLDRVLIQGPKPPLVDETAAWKVPGDGIATNAAVMDIDGDGRPDVLVGDDFGAHRVLRNNGKFFEPHGQDVGFHGYAHAMGWGFGDFDHDGLVDVTLADLGPSPVYTRLPPAKGLPFRFRDCGGGLGVWGPTRGASGWSPVVGDLDHDGNEDLVMGLSISVDPADLAKIAANCKDGNPGADNADVVLLYDNGTFAPTRLPPGPAAEIGMLTQQLADLDGDGDLDLIQVRPGKGGGQSLRILRNDLPKKGQAVTVRVRGKGRNRDALGTAVTAMIGSHQRTRWLYGSGGYGGTSMRWAHFGLGKASKLSGVVVRWPDGSETKVGDLGPTNTKVVTWP